MSLNISSTTPLVPLPAAATAPAGKHHGGARAKSCDDASPANASLWDVLTPEEREFFARQAELGPLSYGRGGAAPNTPPAPTGGRIDVRG